MHFKRNTYLSLFGSPLVCICKTILSVIRSFSPDQEYGTYSLNRSFASDQEHRLFYILFQYFTRPEFLYAIRVCQLWPRQSKNSKSINDPNLLNPNSNIIFLLLRPSRLGSAKTRLPTERHNKRFLNCLRYQHRRGTAGAPSIKQSVNGVLEKDPLTI